MSSKRNTIPGKRQTLAPPSDTAQSQSSPSYSISSSKQQIYQTHSLEPNIDYLYEYYLKYNKQRKLNDDDDDQNNNNSNNQQTLSSTKQEQQQQYIESIIGKYVGRSKYRVVKYLGGGSFGNLYLGEHYASRLAVAIKIEQSNCEQPQLFLEYRFYRKLTRLPRGVPKIYTFGPIDAGRFNALVMELLGPSLEKMHENCGGRFSLRTTIQLTIQLIHLFRGIHDSGILYRDTKPANFLLGRPNTGKWWIVHVVDLGFCKEWRREDGSHIQYQENKPYTGTVRYMSINNNLGREQSRRDDLEALVYMLVFLHKGRLPWQGIVADTIIERYRMIAQCKIDTPISQLCSQMPEEYQTLLQTIRALRFEERPSYSLLLTPFFQLLAREYHLEMNDRVYDWTMSHDIKSPILRFINQPSDQSPTDDTMEQSISYSATAITKLSPKQHNQRMIKMANVKMNNYSDDMINLAHDLDQIQQSIRRRQSKNQSSSVAPLEKLDLLLSDDELSTSNLSSKKLH